ATFSVLKFPPAHPALAEAINRCVAVGEEPLFGETGADLLTEMVVKHDLARFGHRLHDAYPIPALDIAALFDLERWTAYLTLHEEFQAALSAYRLSNEALRNQLRESETSSTIYKVFAAVGRGVRSLIPKPGAAQTERPQRASRSSGNDVGSSS